MRRIPVAVAQTLLALGSFALLRGSGCVVAFCSEHGCDPCLTKCLCSTCPQALAFEPGHMLVAFELVESTGADGSRQLACTWIDGLSVPRATGRKEVTPLDLREFAEGVIGVNHELLDLEPGLGHWKFGSVELAGAYVLVTFGRVDSAGHAAPGALDFLFDAHGKLLEIDRTLP
jgi:hypothetical protein